MKDLALIEYVEFDPFFQSLLNSTREIFDYYQVKAYTTECCHNWLVIKCECACKEFYICAVDEEENGEWFICAQAETDQDYYNTIIYPNDQEDMAKGYLNYMVALAQTLNKF